MHLRTIVLISCAIALSACNSVKGEALPSSADDPKLAEIGKHLDDGDKKLLIGYLMRREMAKTFGGGQPLPDGSKTVGDALDAQRNWAAKLSDTEQKAEALKAEVEQKRKVIADEIAKTVTVAFLNAEFVPSSVESGRYEDRERLTFAVQNSGKRAVKALKGQAVFIDTFGDVIIRLPMKSEDLIGPGEKKEIVLGKDLNKFMDDDKKVMGLDSSTKFRFEPEQIVYADGATLKAPALAD